MGSIMSMRAKGDCYRYPPKSTNPDPNNFKILDTQYVRDDNSPDVDMYLILLVNYPDCTTFEGDKVLVYKNFYHSGFIDKLDPHFTDKEHSPIARFPATEMGKAHALNFVCWLIQSHDKNFCEHNMILYKGEET